MAEVREQVRRMRRPLALFSGLSSLFEAPAPEISMKLSLTRVRLVAACSILTLSLVWPAPLPASAERPSDAGRLLLWLLGLSKAREQGTPRKIDVNSATVEEQLSRVVD
jgi:hypothetical protein